MGVLGELQHQVVGELQQGAAALDGEHERRRQRRLAVQRAEDVAADRAGRVAVAGVGHGERQRVEHLVGSGMAHRRVHGDGQRLLRDPATAQPLDGRGGGSAARRGAAPPPARR